MYRSITTEQTGDTMAFIGLIKSSQVMAETLGIFPKRIRLYSEEEMKEFQELDKPTPQVKAALRKLL